MNETMEYDFDFDCHTHTKEYSLCGEMTLGELLAQKKTRGPRLVAVTDHSSHFYYPAETLNQWLDKPGVFESRREKGNQKLEEYLDRLAAVRDQGILTGLELDYIIGDGLFFDEKYRRRFDVLIGSVHWLPCMLPFFEKHGGDHSRHCPFDLGEFIHWTGRMLESGIDVLGHPTNLYKWAGLEPDTRTIHWMIDAAKANHVAVEINCAHKDPGEYFIQKWLEKGGKIVCSSDAHSPAQYGEYSHAGKILRGCGVSQANLKEVLFVPRKGGSKSV
ncbi:MAG: PHP domain-containing protein [Verrucomicrobiae bacterium]|nr:PHP domain-containing protein [Verrucomicrobiae bacterium]